MALAQPGLTLDHASDFDILANLPEAERERIIGEWTPERIRMWRRAWVAHRRPTQSPMWDDPWLTWLYQAGRGTGKTRAGVEAVNEAAMGRGVKRIAICARSFDDLRRTLLYGPSGFASVGEQAMRPRILSRPFQLQWPSGAKADCLSADAPEQGRGPGYELILMDERAFYSRRDKTGATLADNLVMTAREGPSPRIIICTTPLPTPEMKAIIDDPGTRITRESTYDNAANLPLSVIRQWERRYPPGSRLHRQELLGEFVEDVEGALWSMDDLERARMNKPADISEFAKTMERIIVAVDPAVSAHANSDYTAMVVAGRLGEDAYILDARHVKMAPTAWANMVIDAYERWEADAIIAEVNNGGDMVENTIRAASRSWPNVQQIRASRGKAVRAEPVAALYGVGRVFHVEQFVDLEDEMRAFPVAAENDDLVDALSYAVTDLLVTEAATQGVW